MARTFVFRPRLAMVEIVPVPVDVSPFGLLCELSNEVAACDIEDTTLAMACMMAMLPVLVEDAIFWIPVGGRGGMC
jgi:hypothetical protein